jgi:hypothetical protein
MAVGEFGRRIPIGLLLDNCVSDFCSWLFETSFDITKSEVAIVTE